MPWGRGCVEVGVSFARGKHALEGGEPGTLIEGAGSLVVRQQSLPALRTVLYTGDEPKFAHPAELHFARILSFYRVRWSYEPTTFALAWAADGRPAEMFTPDFYLPDLRLYVELTTMRQRLVTRKNRKVRRLRELYPNVRIKLLYRRDYQRLLASYRAPGRDGVSCRVGRVLFSEEAIRTRTVEIAACIAANLTNEHEYPERDAPHLVLGVGRGSEAFSRALCDELSALGVACELDRVTLSRYRTAAGRRVRVRRAPSVDVAGRRVLIVEDVVSTGLSLRYLTAWLCRRGAAKVEVCTLLDRRVARLVDVPVRYAAFEAPNEVLVGYGLSLRRKFRNLPFVAVLELGDG